MRCRPVGEFLVLFLRVEDSRVASASYHTVGCGPTIACGSTLSELVVGQLIGNCHELTAEDLIEALDGVPPDHSCCPTMAIAAMRDAFSHWEPCIEDRAGLTTDCTDTTDGSIE
jgi:nitrogen fixation protein NifU and related proteins